MLSLIYLLVQKKCHTFDQFFYNMWTILPSLLFFSQELMDNHYVNHAVLHDNPNLLLTIVLHQNLYVT